MVTVDGGSRGKLDHDEIVRSSKLSGEDHGVTGGVGEQLDVVRTDHHVDLGPSRKARAVGQGTDLGQNPLLGDAAGQEVGLSHKAGHESGRRLVIDLLRPTDLLQSPLVQDADPVCDHERFLLIMGHKDRGGPQLPEDRIHLEVHLGHQVRIQVAEGFVEEQDGRAGGQGSSQRHSLLLAPGQFVGIAVGKGGKTHRLEHSLDPLGSGRGVQLPQAERDI